jgi:zinc protease
MTREKGLPMRSGCHGARPRARYGVFFAVVCALIGLLASPPAARALTVEEIVSAKGIKAWLVEEHSVPLIAIRFAFKGGASQDQPGKEGQAGMIADLLLEGAGDLMADVLKEKLSRLGVRLSTSSTRDAVYGGLETLTARFGPSAELLRLMLTSPRFDQDAIERVRSQHLTDLAIAANDPARIAIDRWYTEAFKNHPYGRPVDGTPATLAGLTRDDLKAQHARLLARDELKVVIVGDINKAAAAAAIDAIFGDLPEKAQLTRVVRVEPRVLPTPVVVDKDQPLASATFGMASLPNNHPDFPALQVLNHVIGSGDFDALLTAEIRVKRGLAYSIQTGLLYDSNSSLLLGAFSTKNDNMGVAWNAVRDVLATTARNGPTPPQFENAKQYLVGSLLLDFDTNAKVAGSLLGVWLTGEGPDYLTTRNQKISAVTLKDVKRVAEQVLKADQLLVTIVGKPKLTP